MSERRETAEEIRAGFMGRALLEAAGFSAGMVAKAMRRLDEGMDATRQKEFQHEGTVVMGDVRPDFQERREAAKEVARLADFYPNRMEHDVNGEIRFTVLGLDPDKV